MFYCEFPECKYYTLNRNQIHYHHIIPLENFRNDNENNRIWLCPTHHNFIYIPDSKNGIHSIKNDNSIILNGWKLSTIGKILEYIENDEIKYYLREYNNVT